jgi:hypothetical protein
MADLLRCSVGGGYSYAIGSKWSGAKIYVNDEVVTEVDYTSISSGTDVFQHYLYLTKLNTGDLTTIGGDDFYGCKNLTDVIFGEKLTTINTKAFAYCGMSSI